MVLINIKGDNDDIIKKLSCNLRYYPKEIINEDKYIRLILNENESLNKWYFNEKYDCEVFYDLIIMETVERLPNYKDAQFCITVFQRD